MRTPQLAESGPSPLRLQPMRPVRVPGPQLPGRIDASADDPTGAGSANVTITVERSATGCLLRVAGDLDGSTRSLLEAILEHIRDDTCDGRIELDLSDVSFADSQGLLPALASNTSIRTASPAVRSTLRFLEREEAMSP
ncbi:MAG TPA: STAS domain-containing protein [Nocardioidaceae bacterium]|nr:STAS domain-containing protein [Nocardioidaceae bacterium]